MVPGLDQRRQAPRGHQDVHRHPVVPRGPHHRRQRGSGQHPRRPGRPGVGVGRPGRGPRRPDPAGPASGTWCRSRPPGVCRGTELLLLLLLVLPFLRPGWPVLV